MDYESDMKRYSDHMNALAYADEKGEARGVKKVARNMLAKGYSVAEVIGVTNLPREQIRALRQAQASRYLLAGEHPSSRSQLLLANGSLRSITIPHAADTVKGNALTDIFPLDKLVEATHEQTVSVVFRLLGTAPPEATFFDIEESVL